jgi:hypothetical protein
MQGIVVSQASQALSVRDLAAQINREYQQCAGCFSQAREHALRCGALLAEAQAGVKQEGEGWEAWLKANTAIPPSTARLWMRYAREVPRIAEGESANVSAISMRQAVKVIADPAKFDKEDVDAGDAQEEEGSGTSEYKRDPFTRHASVLWAKQTVRDLKTLRALDSGMCSLLVEKNTPTAKELGERLSAALDAADEPDRSHLRNNFAWFSQVFTEMMKKK